jgi:Protein of unknown function (DUF1566)
VASDGQGTGLTIFQWVAQLNAAGFADHTDWWVPNVKELQSIMDYGTDDPVVDAVFNTSYYSLLLGESRLTRRLFAGMLRRIAALPSPAG